MILGVCEWLSGKLGWNVTAIRIAFVVALLAFGTGLRPVFNFMVSGNTV